MRIMLWMYCIEASAGIYESTRLGGARLPGIHMAVYDTYIYNYQIYSNRLDCFLYMHNSFFEHVMCKVGKGDA